MIVAWFAILFTGTYPKGMFGFVEGVIRWNIRVTAYAFTVQNRPKSRCRHRPPRRRAGALMAAG